MGGLRPRVETYRMERILGGLHEEAMTPTPILLPRMGYGPTPQVARPRVFHPEAGPPSSTTQETVATERDIPPFLTDFEGRKLLKEADLKTYAGWNYKRNSKRASLEAESERTMEFCVGHALRL